MRKPIQIQTLLALLLLGCASTYSSAQPAQQFCFTPCGMYSLERVDCVGMIRLEQATLRALERRAKVDRAQACTNLQGWQVSLEQNDKDLCDGVGWFQTHSEGSSCVVGLADSSERQIKLYSTDWRDPWVRRVLAHEIVHAIALDDTAGLYYGHCQWAELGIKRAIRDVSGVDEPAASVCFCAP